jgi:predicted TIM-barrel fold metal-dependent hydrolase
MTASGVPVLDFHARLTPGDREPAALLAAMDEAGIGRSVVSAGGLLSLDRLSAQINDGGRADVAAGNDRVHEQCARSAGRLLPFFFADPVRDVEAYRAAAGRFRGLEISPAVHGFRLDDPAVADLITIAAAARHPVYVVTLAHPGTRPADLAGLARRSTGVTFVWGHCGHTGLDLAGLAELAPVPNVHAELSGCLTVTAVQAVRRFGVSRVLFGTEYPLQHPRVELAKAAALGLTPPGLREVMAGNAGRLLGEETTWRTP